MRTGTIASPRVLSALIGVLSFSVLLGAPAFAAASPHSIGTQVGRQLEQQRYDAFLAREGKIGPATLPLRDQAQLALSDGYAFLPETQGKAFMQRLGNSTDDQFIGIVLPRQMSNWFAFLEYIPAGYVKDDDAKDLNADELLKQIRDNTDEENKVRAAKGVAPLDVIGWVERPHYDKATHRLIWSVEARDRGSKDKDDVINYRTLVLGRQGYISLILVTNMSTIGAQKPIVQQLLSGLSFTNGKRYTDFNASTDHVAEFGLAALIGGVVAHKLGFFALAAAFLAKSVKALILLAAGGLAAVGRFFRRKKNKPDAAPPIGSASVQPPLPDTDAGSKA